MRIIIISVSALMMLSMFAMADTNEIVNDTKSLQALCQELKKNEVSNSSLKVTFSEKPEINSDIHHWLLNWNGIDVPLPPIGFREVYVKMGYENQYEVMMVAKDGFTINTIVFENKLSNDMFEESKDENDRGSGKTESRVVAKKDRSPVRTSDTILLGFQITPGDLSCLKEHQAEEAAKVVALIMKGIARPGELMSVYKGVGVYKGWIEKERSSDYMVYGINIIPNSNQDILYQINYRIPNNSRYYDLPFLTGNNRQKPTSEPPDWLLALNSAIISKSKDFWKRYATLARKAGVSEKSITRVMKNQNIEIEP